MLVLSAKAEKILRSLSVVHLREIRGAIPALRAILEDLDDHEAT